ELMEADINLLRAYHYKLKHNITNAAFSDLRYLFPGHELPEWKVAARRIAFLAKFRPQAFDCCINSCLCYSGARADEEECAYCHEPRWNAHGKARKQFNYIPLIPRLQALYSNPNMINKMRYCGDHVYNEDTIEDIYDSEIYRTLKQTNVSLGGFEQEYHYFENDTDIALGVATDSFAPFKNRKQTC
ncbi:hypothetical protein BKA70DRAFT_1027687, partial [Coprinopsis sp. MPI-PUGE-AT-0042]